MQGKGRVSVGEMALKKKKGGQIEDNIGSDSESLLGEKTNKKTGVEC